MIILIYLFHKVFISHGEKNEWYEQCLHARTDKLDSIPCSGRPLFTLLQTAINDKTPNSDRATSEYCSLLHLEMLFNKMENHDQKVPVSHNLMI